MPRWLSSFLIAVGFLALVTLALLPKNVTVNVQVTDSSNHHTFNGGRHIEEPESPAAADQDN